MDDYIVYLNLSE